MSGTGSDLARGDRYRSGWETSGSGTTGNSNETWQYPEDSTTMSATSGTSAAPAANQATEGISISQRMVSATCGSILTSCLGERRPGFLHLEIKSSS